MANKPMKSIRLPGLSDTYTFLQNDETLTRAGEAADAKAAGDRISILEPPAASENVGKALIVKSVEGGKASEYEFGSAGGLSDGAKVALLDCFEHVAWINGDGQTYYENLRAALFDEIGLIRIDAVFTQGSTEIHANTPLDDLRPYLVVTKYYSGGTSSVATNYALSGTLSVGVSTITVTCGGKTATFDVTVTGNILYELTASDFKICGIHTVRNDQLGGYGYVTDTRISHLGLDILLTGGKSYRFVLDTTVNTTQISNAWVNQTFLSQASMGADNLSRDDMFEPGWDGMGMDVIMTPPASVNNSPIVCFRPTIRYDRNNSAITSTDFLRKLTIMEVD